MTGLGRSVSPRRCRWFGHKFGTFVSPGVWTAVSWCIGGAEDMLVCKRCGIERWMTYQDDGSALKALRDELAGLSDE